MPTELLTHRQTCQPVSPKAPPSATGRPPAGVEEYEFSLSRSTRKFRFRLNGSEWLCSRLVGKWEMLGVDGERGNMLVRCKLRLAGTTAYVYVPKDAEVIPIEHPTLDSHVRLCYARENRAWRLRDERTGKLYSDNIKDYRGVMNVNWMDGGSHVFHEGKVFIDEDGVAHFAP